LGWILLDDVEWDPHYGQVFVELPQNKVSKIKLVAFVVGVDRHTCFFTALGDVLTLTPHAFRRRSVDDVLYLHQILSDNKKKGGKLGTFIKQLIPSETSTGRYAKWAVKSLPRDTAAGGFRPGAINECCSSIPVDFVVHTTGHDLKTVSALYEYVGCCSGSPSAVGSAAGCRSGSVTTGGATVGCRAVSLTGVGTYSHTHLHTHTYTHAHSMPILTLTLTLALIMTVALTLTLTLTLTRAVTLTLTLTLLFVCRHRICIDVSILSYVTCMHKPCD